MTSGRNRFFGCRVARARRKAIRTFNGRGSAFRLIIPRQGKQRTGEGAGASRKLALIVSPAWQGTGAGSAAGRGGAGALARLARLGKAGVLRRRPAATKRAPAARAGSLRGLSLSSFPLLPSLCFLPFASFPLLPSLFSRPFSSTPFLSPLFSLPSIFLPFPASGGLRRFAPPKGAGAARSRCAQAAGPDRFSWRRPLLCRCAQAARAPPSRARKRAKQKTAGWRDGGNLP